jgi:hypothetical protein
VEQANGKQSGSVALTLGLGFRAPREARFRIVSQLAVKKNGCGESVGRSENVKRPGRCVCASSNSKKPDERESVKQYCES